MDRKIKSFLAGTLAGATAYLLYYYMFREEVLENALAEKQQDNQDNQDLTNDLDSFEQTLNPILNDWVQAKKLNRSLQNTVKQLKEQLVKNNQATK